MRKMLGLWGLLMLMLLPLAAGQDVSLYTIPGNISVNSSFLWVADLPDGLGEGVRVSWAVIGLVENGALGSFGKLLGNEWFCDFERTCGPNPFPMAGDFDANIYITSGGGVLAEQQAITVSDLMLDPHLYITGNEVLVQVYVPGSSAILRYSLYDAVTLDPVWLGGKVVKDKNLPYCNCPAGFYDTTLNLENGRYYLSFDAISGDKAGGSLHYFTIGEELELVSASLDRDEYWLGEMVRISGTTTYPKAAAEISRAGVSEKNVTFSLYSRGGYSEFSYDYLPGETGEYEIDVIAGEGNDSASQALEFSVSRLLDMTIPDIHINESETLERNFSVTNLVNQTLNITVSPGEGLEGYVTATLDKGSLGYGDRAVLTLSIRNILSSVQGGLVFHTGVTDVEETLRIIVQKPFEKKPKIGIEPLSWSPEEGYLLGEPATKVFTLTNQGTGTLEGFDYSLSGIESTIVTVSLPDSVGMIPDSGEVEVSVDPLNSGRYRGVLRVTSNGGSQDVLIDAEFFDDISDGIGGMELELQSVISELTARGMELPYTVSELASDLAVVRDSLDMGDYASAGRAFEMAESKWAGVKSMVALLPEPGMDLSLVLIVVVVVIAAAGGFLFMKRRGRSGKPEKEEEETGEPEELEDEFY